jgi:hypothetical protein
MARPARLHFSDEDLDGQPVRILSMAVVSAADLGEAMTTAAPVDRHRLLSAPPVPAGSGSR